MAESRWPRADEQQAVAVLVSGGLDSAILLVELLQRHELVYPLYIRTGLHWENVEREHLERFLHAVTEAGLRPLQVLDMPVRDLYHDHWSITGRDVPDGQTPDEAVYLPGRNVLLLAKGMLWCHLHGVPKVALGVLGSNPFPDATPQFFTAYQDAVNQAVQGRVEIVLPFAGKSKREVMALGAGLPLGLTFSCIRPLHGRHCGRCNKCAERRRAFADAALPDPTEYQPEGSCTG
jgi:7-cyano-7-deazaguanine synthase